MLFFIAILIIGIALVNYINLSIALAPIRTKSITIQKVLGSSDATLRKYLVLESLGISVVAFFLALLFLLFLNNVQWVTNMVGASVEPVCQLEDSGVHILPCRRRRYTSRFVSCFLYHLVSSCHGAEQVFYP